MSIETINPTNHMIVQKYIEEKINNKPMYRVGILSTKSYVSTPTTDMDHFPYQRYYRGLFDLTMPRIIEREAGYRERHDACYQTQYIAQNVEPPDLFFQAACSTTYPSYKTKPTVCYATYY